MEKKHIPIVHFLNIRLVITFAALVFLALVAFFFLKKVDPLPESDIEETDAGEEVIQHQLEELDAIREERRQGEEYAPPTEEDIQRQIEELDSLRRR